MVASTISGRSCGGEIGRHHHRVGWKVRPGVAQRGGRNRRPKSVLSCRPKTHCSSSISTNGQMNESTGDRLLLKVAIDVANIAATSTQRRAHGERLRDPHERVRKRPGSRADGYSPMTSPTMRGRTCAWRRRGEGPSAACGKNAAMHRLKTVAHIGQSTADDHRQGIEYDRFISSSTSATGCMLSAPGWSNRPSPPGGGVKGSSGFWDRQP